MNAISVPATITNMSAAKTRTKMYASRILTALGECGVTGSSPPFPATAAPTQMSAPAHEITDTSTLRLTPAWHRIAGGSRDANRAAAGGAPAVRGVRQRDRAGRGHRLQ